VKYVGAKDHAEFPIPIGSLTTQIIGCPVTGQQDISIRYYLQLGDTWYDGQPKIINAWIELLFDRRQPGLDGPFPNANYGAEWVFRSPPLPKPGANGKAFPFKVFTNDEIVDSCL
jgi:hypothetical protein